MGAKEYTIEYKKEAIKLSKKIDAKQASVELGVPISTLYGWLERERSGEIDLGSGSRAPLNLLSLSEETKVLSEKIKEYENLFRGTLFCEEWAWHNILCKSVFPIRRNTMLVYIKIGMYQI